MCAHSGCFWISDAPSASSSLSLQPSLLQRRVYERRTTMRTVLLSLSLSLFAIISVVPSCSSCSPSRELLYSCERTSARCKGDDDAQAAASLSLSLSLLLSPALCMRACLQVQGSCCYGDGRRHRRRRRYRRDWRRTLSSAAAAAEERERLACSAS